MSSVEALFSDCSGNIDLFTASISLLQSDMVKERFVCCIIICKTNLWSHKDNLFFSLISQMFGRHPVILKTLRTIFYQLHQAPVNAVFFFLFCVDSKQITLFSFDLTSSHLIYPFPYLWIENVFVERVPSCFHKTQIVHCFES